MKTSLLRHRPLGDARYRHPPYCVRLSTSLGPAWVHRDSAAALHLDADRPALRKMIESVTVGEGDAARLRTLKEDPVRSVYVVKWRDRQWITKHYHPDPWKTLLNHLMHRTGAWREWLNVPVAVEAGVKASVPFALVHHSAMGRWRHTLILPYHRGCGLGEWLANNGATPSSSPAQRAERLALARLVGEQVGYLMKAGYLHRDLKVDNLLVTPVDASDHPHANRTVMIDLVALLRDASFPAKWRMLGLMTCTAERAGSLTRRERLTALRAASRIDPSIRFGHRGHRAAIHEIRQVCQLIRIELGDGGSNPPTAH